MIRILHTIDTTGSGGAETVFVNLVKGLYRHEFEPFVAITGAGWVSDELEKYGITPFFINSKGSFNVRYLLELIRIIRTHDIDIVQSHLLGSNLYCSLAGMICRIPVVSTFHGFVDINAKERFATIKSAIINKGSSRLVFVSDRLKSFYTNEKRFCDGKAVTIYNGVDTVQFSPGRDDSLRRRLGLDPDDLLVGAVGNLRSSKGYTYLLEAARLVADRNPRFRFVVAGDGNGILADELVALQSRLGLERIFHFSGFEPDVVRLMRNLDFFVLPSVSEGFSIATIEAMACGVPVVVTRSGGPEEIVRHMENGLLVEPRCPEKIAEALLKLHDQKALREQFRVRGIEEAIKRYSSATVVNHYAALYRQLTDGGADHEFQLHHPALQ